MKLGFGVFAFAMLGSNVLLSCSDGSVVSRSSLNDVASPGSPGASNVLLWIDKDVAFKGTCVNGKPTSRVHCSEQVETVTVQILGERSITKADFDISNALAAVAAEIKTLKDSDPSVVAMNTQIQTLEAKVTSVQLGIVDRTQQLETMRATKGAADSQIAYIDEQLVAIAKQLQATPNDRDLLVHQATLRTERKPLASESTLLASKINDLAARIAFDRDRTLKSAQTDLVNAQSSLKKLYSELLVSSSQLEALISVRDHAKAVHAAINPAIGLIRAGAITYRGNLLGKVQQDSLHIITSSFEASDSSYVVE